MPGVMKGMVLRLILSQCAEIYTNDQQRTETGTYSISIHIFALGYAVAGGWGVNKLLNEAVPNETCRIMSKGRGGEAGCVW